MLKKGMKGGNGREEFLFLNPRNYLQSTLLKKDSNCPAGGELTQVGLDWRKLQAMGLEAGL